MKKAGDNTIWLDIETGGTNPAQSSILSAAWGKTGNIKSHFAAPIEGSFLSEFSEKNIIPQLTSAVKSGKDILEEKQLIETLISELEADRGAAIAGFNIRGFDFGFIQRRARIYGMEARFTSALAGRSYVDPIHQVKNVIASSILEHAEGGLFNQVLGVKSWQEAGEKYADLPFKKRPVEYNLISSIEGYLKSGRDRAQFKGWKLEDVNKLLESHSGAKTLQGGAAHEAAADLVMSRRVIDATKSGELREALKRPEIASEWLNITKSRGFHQFGGGRLLTQADIGSLAPGAAEAKFIKSNWKLALGVGAAAIIAASVFTARDDNYNTIEGLPHGNFAQSKRLELTSFGSGWQGIGIDQKITDFKENVWSDPEQKSAIKKIIAEEQAAALEDLGSFEEDEYSIRAGNFKGSAAKTVASIKLDQFNIETEDADTLILKRKGLLNFFDNPIQVRLAGIDAPEVGSHGRDPLSIIRFAQEQPFGKEASSRLQEIIEDAKNLSLVITGEKTYGRYLGAVTDGNTSIAEQLVSEGMVTALPFGKKEADLLDRKALDKAQDQAIQEERGLWSLTRYKFVNEVNQNLKNPVTHNTLTRLDKLADGNALAAYSSKLESFGTSTDQLTSEQLFESKGIGRALAAFFKPRMSGKDDAHNTIEGLGHKGIAQDKRHQLTNFGSGVRGIFKIPLEMTHGVESTLKGMMGFQTDISGLTAMVKYAEILQTQRTKVLHPETKKLFDSFYDQVAIAEKAGHKNVIGIVEEGLHKEANRLDMSPTKLLKSVLAHENVHIGSTSLNNGARHKRGFSINPRSNVQEGYWQDYLKEIKYNMGNADSYSEEKLAHAIGNAFEAPHLPMKEKRMLAKPLGKTSYDETKAAAIERMLSTIPEDSRLAAKAEIDAGFSSKFSFDPRGRGGLAHLTKIKLEAKIIAPNTSGTNDDFARSLFETTIDKPLSRSDFNIGLEYMREGVRSRARKARQYRDGIKPKMSGKDDAHNTIEGLGHKGIGQKFRKFFSPFGSGWDALRNLVKGKETFQQMVSSTGFQKAMSSATHLKELASGHMGTAHLMQTSFRGKEFQFVRKTGMLGSDEASTMKALQNDFAPSVYSSSSSHIDMELFQGKTFREVIEAGEATPEHFRAIKENARIMESKGFAHGDYHKGNIMVTPEGQVGAIDFGASGPIGSSGETAFKTSSGQIQMGFYGGYRKNAFGELVEESIEVRSAAYDQGRIAQMEYFYNERQLLAGASTRKKRKVQQVVEKSTTIQTINEQTNVVAAKKLSRAEMQLTASSTTWKAGINGGRRSKMG